MYINDLPENIQSQVWLFADVTAVYLTVSSLQDSQVLQSDLDSLQCWEQTWDKGPSKCQVHHITRSRKPVMSRYFMQYQELESVDTAKYLGVGINRDLSWNTHINNIAACAKRTLGFVKRNVQTKNKDIRTQANNSLVRPQVEYGSAVWSPYTKENKDKIEMVQRRASRWVSSDYSTYSSVYERSGKNLFWSIINSGEILNKLKSRGFHATSLSTYDFSTLYTHLPHNLLKEKFINLIEWTFKREGSPYIASNERHAFVTSGDRKRYKLWSCQTVCEDLIYFLDNIYIRFSTKLYRQIVGIPMGTNCASLVADLFLFCYERDFMTSLSDVKQAENIEAFKSTSRCLDDLLNIDNPYFEGMVNRIYPPELQLNKTNTSDSEASFWICIYLFQTDLFHLKFMINAMTLILI